MRIVNSGRVSLIDVFCLLATAVWFFVTPTYLAHAYGMLNSPDFFARWRWAGALAASALGVIAFFVQMGILLLLTYRKCGSTLTRLAMYVSVYWILVAGFSTLSRGLSRVYPLRVYLSPYGLAGPSWAERYGPARTHVRCPPDLKINPRNGGPANGPGGRKR